MRTKTWRRWFPSPALSVDPMSSAQPMLLERPLRAPRTTAPRRQPDPPAQRRPAKRRPARHRRPRGRLRSLLMWVGGALGAMSVGAVVLWPGLLPALAAQARAHSDTVICTVLLTMSFGALWRMNREL